MKIIASSDFHVDWTTLGVPRWDEVEAAAWKTVEHAVKEKADLYLFLGDLADPDTGGSSFRAAGLAIEIAQRLRDEGIISVWIAGNHDVWEDGSGASTLTPLASFAKATNVSWQHQTVFVAERPALFTIRLAKGALPSLFVLALPFVATSHGEDMSEAVTRLWPDAPPAPVIVASHLMVDGVHPGTETTEMPRGREIGYPVEATARAHMRLQGHYHRAQSVPMREGPPMIIPGNLARLTFGEENHEPSFLDLEV